MKIKDALDLTRDEQWTLKMPKSMTKGEVYGKNREGYLAQTKADKKS